MVEFKQTYIDPEDALGSLIVLPKIAQVDANLGPSGPHADDTIEPAELAIEIPFEPPTVGAKLSFDPSAPRPPVLAAHYTQILDEIWPEFDQPEERTAERLDALLDEVADEAQRVLVLKQGLWETLPSYKMPESERKRFDAEFLAYLRRLNDYRKALAELPPQSTDTDSVHVGLVQRRQGAGPVPDVIMHMYFAQQLGILADHADEMGKGFVGRVLDGLSATARVIDEATDSIDERKEKAEEAILDWWRDITRPFKIAGWVMLGTIVAVGGTIIAVKIADRGKDE